jgi:ribosomal protein S1
VELRGQVTNVVPYGAFVDIKVGRDGLIHRSRIPALREPTQAAAGRGRGAVGGPGVTATATEDAIFEAVHVLDRVVVRVVGVDRAARKVDLELVANLGAGGEGEGPED